MSTHKHFDKICCVILAFTLVLTVVFMNFSSLNIEASERKLGYEDRIFSTDKVHTINIIIDDWDGFLEGCTDEEYVSCAVVIDNESYKNVAIRAKGNTSLSNVQNYGNNRYSFKIEFDHYDSTKSYYGLDKLSLNNIIQDNTYIKDYLCYQMMGYFGADAPLCSFAQILVNGEEWGLYLAVEGIEESFLQRNYGSDYGELYKPDSQSMGGGRGNGDKFNMDDWENDGTNTEAQQQFEKPNAITSATENKTQRTGRGEMPNMTSGEQFDFSEQDKGNNKAEFGGMGSMGSDDVKLVYTDDNYSSYSNIFNNAKTDITDTDKDRLIASLKNLNENTDIEETVNIDEVIRYFVVHNFVCNFDSYTGSMIHNYYLYENDGQLSMIPWDYNLAFGGFTGGTDATSTVNFPIDSPVSGGDISSRPMLSWIFENEEYTELYHKYFNEFISSYFDSGYFEEMIDSIKEMISPYVESDPTKFCTYDEFTKGIDTLKQFCLLRAESIHGQLDGTIPSTSDGQNNDSSSLINAKSINISDMGSMQNAGGMKNQNNNFQSEEFPVRGGMNEDFSEIGDNSEAQNFNEGFTPDDNMKTGQFDIQQPENSTDIQPPSQSGENMMDFQPNNADNNKNFNENNDGIFLSVLSVLVLGLGIAVAMGYKKHS